MKIVFCNNDLKLGGAQRRLSQLIIGLDKYQDCEVYVFLTDRDIAFKEVLNTKAKFFYLNKNVKKYTFFIEFRNLLKEINPDIVHCWSLHQAYYLNILAPFSSFKYICGTITSSHKLSYKTSQFYIERLSFWLSDVIVSNSHSGLKAKQTPDKKSRVIYNGYDFSRQHNLRAEDDLRRELGLANQAIVSMASRVSPQKDIEMLVRVASRLGDNGKNIVILMLGDGPQLEYYRRFVKDKSIPNIIFLGYRNDVESIIHISTLCILCSKYEEGVSNSIMESLADGKPVIATEGGGTNEIVFSGENGFLVKPGDDESMAQKIEYLIDNPEECNQMGRRAIEIINKKFLLSHMVEEYIKLYNELINNQ
ncbi:MAG: glycosyltransferase [Bacteroidales bacterium]|nr:glycosyltransferase [Bacteroidales bacterium]